MAKVQKIGQVAEYAYKRDDPNHTGPVTGLRLADGKYVNFSFYHASDRDRNPLPIGSDYCADCVALDKANKLPAVNDICTFDCWENDKGYLNINSWVKTGVGPPVAPRQAGGGTGGARTGGGGGRTWNSGPKQYTPEEIRRLSRQNVLPTAYLIVKDSLKKGEEISLQLVGETAIELSEILIKDTLTAASAPATSPSTGETAVQAQNASGEGSQAPQADVDGFIAAYTALNLNSPDDLMALVGSEEPVTRGILKELASDGLDLDLLLTEARELAQSRKAEAPTDQPL